MVTKAGSKDMCKIESKVNYLKQQRASLEVVTSAILEIVQSIQGFNQNHRNWVICSQQVNNVNNLGVHGLEIPTKKKLANTPWGVVVLIIPLVLEVLH